MYEKYLKHKLDVKGFFNEKLFEAFASGYYGIKNNKDQHPISAFQCFLCETVQKQEFSVGRTKRIVYDCPTPRNPFRGDNTWSTFWTYGKCELKALQYFFNKTLNVTEEMFTNKSMEYLKENDCE